MNDLEREAAAAAALIAAFHEAIADDEQAKADLVEGQTSFFDVVDAVLGRLTLVEDHIEALVAHGRKLNDRNRRFKQQYERLRTALLSAMEATDFAVLRRPIATVSRKTVPPGIQVLDETKVPAEFHAPQPIKIDMAKLKEAAKAGDIPGVTWTNGGSTIAISRS